ncbi:MAG: hypothetical protein U5L00_06590 [Desulfovermiculus sp.]|nr:hypothetical protein [Desulfovermiculus sp.]
MSKEVTYKNHTIRIDNHPDVGSTFSFVIIDSEGKEIKHVPRGGDTEESAIQTAQEMIDFESKLSEE